MIIESTIKWRYFFILLSNVHWISDEMTLRFHNHIRFIFRKKKLETITTHYDNCFKNFSKKSLKCSTFWKCSTFSYWFRRRWVNKKNMSTFTVVDNDQQRIRKLQNEVIRLRNETKISKLKIRIKRFRAKVDATTFAESFFVIIKNVSASRKKIVFDDDETTKSMTIFHKSLKFNKLKNYKEFFEKKHRHWMRDAKLIFIKNFDYFSNDRTKILWCMTFLIDDSQTQWFNHCVNDLKLNDVIFDDFENFLLNLIVDSMNRRLNVYERWKKLNKIRIKKLRFSKFIWKIWKVICSNSKKFIKRLFFLLNFVMSLNKKFLISKTFRIFEKIF